MHRYTDATLWVWIYYVLELVVFDFVLDALYVKVCYVLFCALCVSTDIKLPVEVQAADSKCFIQFSLKTRSHSVA